MGFEKIFCIKESKEMAVIGSGYTPTGNVKFDRDCYIVRSDCDMVYWPVLWKRGGQYRIFPYGLMDKIYQLRKKKSKTVVIFWEQGVDISSKVGKILYQ